MIVVEDGPSRKALLVLKASLPPTRKIIGMKMVDVMRSYY